MDHPERGWSVSFAGCGFLSPYYLGVTDCVSERAPHLFRGARRVFGSSAGSVQAVVLLGGVPVESALKMFNEFYRRATSHRGGVFHPTFDMSRILREELRSCLPANIHQLAAGRLFVSLTRVSDLRNVLVSEFRSKEEVVDRYVDGGLTNCTPFFDAKTTITVSPFSGEYDICPKVKSMNFVHMEFGRSSIQLCSENLHLFSRMLIPKNVKETGEFCLQGYLDAARFLEENGICNRPQPCLGSSSQEPDAPVPRPETPAPGASPGLATCPASPKRKELLDRLGHDLLPWDASILDKLSPRLLLALSNRLKKEKKLRSKVRNFLPVKVMSYVMLPCTLPVEYAVVMAQRLVKWLPHAPDDIQWLQVLTSQICSRVITHLLPADSSQMLAGSRQPSHTHQSMTGTSGLPTPRGPGCPPRGLTGAGQD